MQPDLERVGGWGAENAAWMRITFWKLENTSADWQNVKRVWFDFLKIFFRLGDVNDAPEWKTGSPAEKEGLSQVEVSEKLDMSRQAVSR